MSSQDLESMRGLQRYLIQELKAIPGIHLNGPEELDKRICNNVNFSYDAVEGDILLNELSLEGYCVSTGSACQSRHSRVSHVLKAINCPPIYIHGNLRIGLSKYTTQRDLEGFILKLKEIIQKDSPFKLYR
jgi:cysteine desulfurase